MPEHQTVSLTDAGSSLRVRRVTQSFGQGVPGRTRAYQSIPTNVLPLSTNAIRTCDRFPPYHALPVPYATVSCPVRLIQFSFLAHAGTNSSYISTMIPRRSAARQSPPSSRLDNAYGTFLLDRIRVRRCLARSRRSRREAWVEQGRS